MNKNLKKGLLLTWLAVASIVIGGILRIEVIPERYLLTFDFAAWIYGIGWLMSVLASALPDLNEK
jgi:hypothetical protein